MKRRPWSADEKLKILQKAEKEGIIGAFLKKLAERKEALIYESC